MNEHVRVKNVDNGEIRIAAVIDGTVERPTRIRWTGGGVYPVRDGWVCQGTKVLRWRVVV